MAHAGNTSNSAGTVKVTYPYTFTSVSSVSVCSNISASNFSNTSNTTWAAVSRGNKAANDTSSVTIQRQVASCIIAIGF